MSIWFVMFQFWCGLHWPCRQLMFPSRCMEVGRRQTPAALFEMCRLVAISSGYVAWVCITVCSLFGLLPLREAGVETYGPCVISKGNFGYPWEGTLAVVVPKNCPILPYTNIIQHMSRWYMLVYIWGTLTKGTQLFPLNVTKYIIMYNHMASIGIQLHPFESTSIQNWPTIKTKRIRRQKSPVHIPPHAFLRSTGFLCPTTSNEFSLKFKVATLIIIWFHMLFVQNMCFF